ncbi:tetratricopeptide repeat protein, partial [Vibrio parahaemolyticus]
LAFQPRHLQANVGKGLVNLQQRHIDAAEAAFNAALAIKPNVAEVLVYRGRLYHDMGRLDRAESDFDAALAIDPSLEAAWRGKAQVGLRTGAVG